MDDADVERLLARLEEAVAQSTDESKGKLDVFFSILLGKTERIVCDLDAMIRLEGVNYPTPNEPRATARALLWSG